MSVPHGARPRAAAALGAATQLRGGAEDGAEGRGPRPIWRPPSRPGPPRMRWRPCRRPGSRPPWSPDAAALTTDEQLWARGYFGLLERHDHGLDGEYAYSGPPFGGGADAGIRNAHPVGADTREILASVAGYPPEEIDRLFAAGAVGTGAPAGPSGPRADPATRIERGELSRVDPEFRSRLAAAKGRR